MDHRMEPEAKLGGWNPNQSRTWIRLEGWLEGSGLD